MTIGFTIFNQDDNSSLNIGLGGAFGYVNDRLQSIWDSARLGYDAGGFSLSYSGNNFTGPASTNQVTVGVPVGPAMAEVSATYRSDEGTQSVTGATGQVTSGGNSVQLGSSGLDTNAPKTALKATVEAAAGVLVGFTGTREGNAWTSGAMTSDVKTSSDWAQAVTVNVGPAQALPIRPSSGRLPRPGPADLLALASHIRR